jgi:hypothetical protein
MLHLHLIVLFTLPQSLAFQQAVFSDSFDEECKIESDDWAEEQRLNSGPMVPCETLGYEWFECEDVTQLAADNSSRVS